VSAFLAGMQLSLGHWVPPWLPDAAWAGGARALPVGIGVPPFLAVAVIGLALL
jgi:hypothetical protein